MAKKPTKVLRGSVRGGKDTFGVPRGVLEGWQNKACGRPSGHPRGMAKKPAGVRDGVLEGWQRRQWESDGKEGNGSPRGIREAWQRVPEGILGVGTKPAGVPEGILQW